tara:strand:+ start:5499 stop:5606 length:108 start_codon:yes stop_codon:yes gene_type:complete
MTGGGGGGGGKKWQKKKKSKIKNLPDDFKVDDDFV